MPEERGLYKKMQVEEQLVYLAQLKGLLAKEALVQVGEWLERLDLVSWAKHSVEDLSKGMQQKVQFIVTVIHEPELLILDEPFSGFDPINAQLIKNEIVELRKTIEGEIRLELPAGRNQSVLAEMAKIAEIKDKYDARRFSKRMA